MYWKFIAEVLQDFVPANKALLLLKTVSKFTCNSICYSVGKKPMQCDKGDGVCNDFPPFLCTNG